MSRACFVAVRAPRHICSKMTFGRKGVQGENERRKIMKKAAQGSRDHILKCIRLVRYGQNQKDKMPRK